MSTLSNIQATTCSNLDGLSVINADEIYVNGEKVDISNLVPYTGATQTLDMGAQRIKTAHAPVDGDDVVNLDTLTNAVTFVDSSVALTYLSKIAVNPQTVAGRVQFQDGIRMDDATAGNWTITTQYIDAYTTNLVFTNSTGPTIRFTGDNGFIKSTGWSPQRVTVINSTGELTTSSVTTTTLGYLDATSSIQTQLNGKLADTGGQAFNTYDFTSPTPILLSGFTGSRVLTTNASKYLTESAVTTTTLGYLDATSSVQTQLNNKLSTSGGTVTGALTVTGSLTTGTRLLGTPDGSGSGNFWIGLTGSNTEADRVAIAINGAATTGVVSRVTVAKDIYFNSPTPLRALILDGSSKLTASATTSTELSYLSGTTSSVQSQLNARVLKTGDTMTGPLQVNSTLGVTNTTSIGIAGANPATTASLNLSSTGNHYDNSASQAYLFNGPNGEIEISYSTTRNATTANLLLGAPSTDISEIVSISGDGSAILPLNEMGSVITLIGQDVAYANRASNPLTAQVQIKSKTKSNVLKLGTYYTSGVNTCAVLQSSDFYSSADHGQQLLFNPLGGNVGIGSGVNGTYYEANCKFTINANYSAGDTGAFCINASDNASAPNIYNFRIYPYVQSGGNVAYQFLTYNGSTAYNSFKILSTGTVSVDGYIGVGTQSPTTLLEVSGSGTLIGARNPSGGDNYAGMRLGNNTGYGCYWFLNSSDRSVDGGTNGATIRNDLGSMRLQTQYGLGITMDNDGCKIANCSNINSNNPGSANMAGYFGITRAEARNSAGLWTGIDTGNNVWQLSLRPDISWNGFNARAASFTWYVSNGPTNGSLLINNNGAVNVAGNSTVAVPNGYMARGSLTIGSTDSNYGWGYQWTGNTAGLMFECADLTEIAVHDSGHRVASMIAYAGGNGRNIMVLGRDMGWGPSFIETASSMSVAGSSSFARFNVYNPNGSWTHFGSSDYGNCNYIRGRTIINSGFLEIGDSYVWRAPLDITTTVGRDNGAVRYFDVYGGLNYTNWYSYSSMQDTAGASRFMAYSDIRKKKNIKPVEDVLEQIDKLKIVSYDHIDTAQPHNYFGIIAQDIEAHYPQMINKGLEFLPNIYEEVIAHQCSKCGEFVILEMKSQIDTSHVGKKLKLITFDEDLKKEYDEYTEIISISDTKMKVKIWKKQGEVQYEAKERVLVYGTCEDDVLTVDKSQFGFMAVAGVQELMKQVDTLQQRNQILEQYARQQSQDLADYKKLTEERFEKLTKIIISLSNS